MAKALGKARIRVDSQLIDSMKGATMSMGGDVASSKSSTQKIHYTEEFKPGRLEAKFPLTGDVSLTTLKNLRDVPVTFETDVGKIYTSPKMSVVDDMKASDSDGEVSLTMEGEPFEEHG